MRGKKPLAVLLGVMVLVSTVAVPVAALAFGASGNAPNPMTKVDTVTKSSHDMEWSSWKTYEADDGTTATLDATLNRTSDVDDLGTGTVNPFSFVATDINFSDADKFPRKGEDDNSASALDASEWTVSGAAMSDVETAPNVDAVEFAASAAGETATYSNFSVTSDAEKRYFQAVYDIESASGATVVNATIHDSTDGDTIVIELYNSSAKTDADDVAANSTGDGVVYQQQLGSLTASGGDGTLDEIGKVVVAADGSANVDFSAINMEKMGEWTFGEKYVDTDSDDELETETIKENTGGQISVHSLSTLGSTFDSAVIHDLQFPAHFEAAELDDGEFSAEFNKADSYPGFDFVADIHYDMELPSAYDLSYSGVDMVQTTNWPGERYVNVEYAEAVSDSTDYADIEDSSWTSKTSSFDAQDKEVTIDSTISPGDRNVVHFEIKLTGDEKQAMAATSGGSGGAGGIFGSSNGGIFGFLTSLPGILVSGVVAFFGGRKLGVL